MIGTLLRNSFNLNPAILSVVEAEMAGSRTDDATPATEVQRGGTGGVAVRSSGSGSGANTEPGADETSTFQEFHSIAAKLEFSDKLFQMLQTNEEYLRCEEARIITDPIKVKHLKAQRKKIRGAMEKYAEEV